MRNKIKQMMKKEEGFTLVELLAVIVILGIIVAIAIPAIGNVIDKANSDSITAENALVEDAARLYFVSEGTTLKVGDTPVEYTVEQLKQAGFLEERGETADLAGTVTITKTESTTETDAGGNTTTSGSDGYTYEFVRSGS